MDVEQIRELRLGHPFRPFTLILDDGQRLPVEIPTRLAISPKGKELAYGGDDGPFFFSPARVRGIDVNGLPEAKSA